MNKISKQKLRVCKKGCAYLTNNKCYYDGICPDED